ncbi:hypothetical protein BDZ45DRAFT_734326 [Acephala macrosclerotiorum]|nr:hypothetical protein BDZ45DRAFT_734326 [Acephala macrosclerotiorum]
MDSIVRPRYATTADGIDLISLNEFAQHKDRESAWIAIKQKGEKMWIIYGVAEFIDFHPGGEDVLLRYAGRDASNVYNSKHGDNRINEIDKVSKVGIIEPKTITRAFELTGCVAKPVKTRPKPAKPECMSVFCEQIAKDEKAGNKRKRPSDFEEEGEIEEEVASTGKKPKKTAPKTTTTTVRPRGRPKKVDRHISKPAHDMTGNRTLNPPAKPISAPRKAASKKFDIEVALKQALGNKDPSSREYPQVVSDLANATTVGKRGRPAKNAAPTKASLSQDPAAPAYGEKRKGRPPKVQTNLKEFIPNTDYDMRDEEERLAATAESTKAMEAEVNILVERGFVSPHDVPMSIHLSQELDSARRASLSREIGRGGRRVTPAGKRRGTGCKIIRPGDPRYGATGGKYIVGGPNRNIPVPSALQGEMLRAHHMGLGRGGMVSTYGVGSSRGGKGGGGVGRLADVPPPFPFGPTYDSREPGPGFWPENLLEAGIYVVQGQPVRFLRGGKIAIRGAGSQRGGGFVGHTFNINEDGTTFGTMLGGMEIGEDATLVPIGERGDTEGRKRGIERDVAGWTRRGEGWKRKEGKVDKYGMFLGH